MLDICLISPTTFKYQAETNVDVSLGKLNEHLDNKLYKDSVERVNSINIDLSSRGELDYVKFESNLKETLERILNYSNYILGNKFNSMYLEVSDVSQLGVYIYSNKDKKLIYLNKMTMVIREIPLEIKNDKLI